MAMRPRTFLQAVLHNESGGRNIPNVHQGTSSGQAQGYFQITTGTWREFAQKAGIDLGRYPNALSAPYDVQARVANVIPFKRWDESTVAAARAAGRRVDPNATFGENLAMNGESFADFSPGATNQYKLPSGYAERHVGGAGSSPEYFKSNPAEPGTRHVGGAGSAPGNFVDPTDPLGVGGTQPTQPDPTPYFLGGKDAKPKHWLEVFGTKLEDAAAAQLPQARKFQSSQPKAALVEGQVAPSVAPQDPNRRMALAQIMAQLNSGRLFG